MSEEKKLDEMFAAGLFNEYVIGAIRITLGNLDYPRSDIDDAVHEYVYGMLALYDVRTLREAAEKDDLECLESRKGVDDGGQEAAYEVRPPE